MNTEQLEYDIRLEWTTFEGKKCSFVTADHQHLSNCFYHWKYAVNGYNEHSIIRMAPANLKIIQYAIDKRFDGKLLPYRPHVNFKDEIAALKRAGYLQPDGKIIVDGKEIGELVKSIQMDDGTSIPFEDILSTSFQDKK